MKYTYNHFQAIKQEERISKYLVNSYILFTVFVAGYVLATI